MGVISEFKEFLKEYKIIALAIALIIGLAATALIKALVDDIIMPVISPFIPGGAWREAVVTIGPIVMKLGAFIGELINFIIIALVIFLMAKFILKEEKVVKK